MRGRQGQGQERRGGKLEEIEQNVLPTDVKLRTLYLEIRRQESRWINGLNYFLGRDEGFRTPPHFLDRLAESGAPKTRQFSQAS